MEHQKTHVLKTWPEHWDAIADGSKPFELRKDDRGYQTGDRLILQGFDRQTNSYNFNEIVATVGYILRGPVFGLEAGHVIMGITVHSICRKQ